MILTIHRHVITRLARFSVSHDNAMTWLLHVSQVQQEDRGYYMCQVNTNPMISQVGYLQVVVTVYEGDTLSLQRISRTEMGAYLCIATNAVPPSVSKRIIVDVEYTVVERKILLLLLSPNGGWQSLRLTGFWNGICMLVGAPSGTDVTVDCHTEAHPRAISYWVYDNVMVLPTKKYAINTDENSYRAHMKLTVRNLQSGDFGNYRCISKNSLGETEGSIRLYEIPMPSTSPKATEMKSTANKESTYLLSRL
ncbi:unnamed protein product [Leptidea sinapis]|uniref:Ig-like domain-containing protein n=1 Tax=Leptidea sinapis TaxID=189913 RepID=A0A5E4Q2A9_9NEOP|nr:unnamed protein product [Leptidea sinapis]